MTAIKKLSHSFPSVRRLDVPLCLSQGTMKSNYFAVLLSCLCCLPYLAQATEKTIYGLNEYVLLDDFDMKLPAKLDTGAMTASLSARNIQRFKRDGETWVRFEVATDSEQPQQIEKPLARISKIKRRAGDYDPKQGKTYTARPVVHVNVCMGESYRRIEVNLTDRSAFEYPLLIGSTALETFDALVDPSLKYAAGKPDCTTTVANSAE